MYKILIKTKTNNIEIFNIYSDYIENILGDEEKYQKNQSYKKLIYSETFENEEINYANFNMELLKKNGEDGRYFIISGQKKVWVLSWAVHFMPPRFSAIIEKN